MTRDDQVAVGAVFWSLQASEGMAIDAGEMAQHNVKCYDIHITYIYIYMYT